jgi:hypothetical protein
MEIWGTEGLLNAITRCPAAGCLDAVRATVRQASHSARRDGGARIMSMLARSTQYDPMRSTPPLSSNLPRKPF